MKLKQIIFYFTFLLITNNNVLCEFQFNEDLAINNFRDYLRINTAHPDPDYDGAIVWIEQQAKEIGLKYNIVRFSESKEDFCIWLTWTGRDPSLPSLFLYSHIDVVKVDLKEWQHDPFAADMDAEGNIYARGAQDMKSVGVQYLEAVRILMTKGITPGRTVHIGFIPDEEWKKGPNKGIVLFIRTPEFLNLNIGLLLDEGLPSDNPNEISVFYAQKIALWTKFTAHGASGHGSLLLEDTAAEKILKVINKLMSIRTEEKARLDANKTLHLGEVTSINLNILEGGLEANIIPPKVSATFDMRITPGSPYANIRKFLSDTCTEAGPNVTYEIIHSTSYVVTELDNNSWWWSGIQNALTSLNLTAVPRVFPMGTDGQVTRSIGVPTLGFSPIFNTTIRFHGREEYLNKAVFLQGIRVYEKLIESLVYVHVPPPTTAMPEPPTTNQSHHLVKTEGDNNSSAANPNEKASDGMSSAAKSTSTLVLISISVLIFSYVVAHFEAQ